MQQSFEKIHKPLEGKVYRVTKQQWVFGEPTECFIFAVENRTAASLIPIIEENIAPGSIIISDKWKSYDSIRNCNNQYNHIMVYHSKNFVNPESGAHTNTVERMWVVAVYLQMTIWLHSQLSSSV